MMVRCEDVILLVVNDGTMGNGGGWTDVRFATVSGLPLVCTPLLLCSYRSSIFFLSKGAPLNRSSEL